MWNRPQYFKELCPLCGSLMPYCVHPVQRPVWREAQMKHKQRSLVSIVKSNGILLSIKKPIRILDILQFQLTYFPAKPTTYIVLILIRLKILSHKIFNLFSPVIQFKNLLKLYLTPLQSRVNTHKSATLIHSNLSIALNVSRCNEWQCSSNSI